MDFEQIIKNNDKERIFNALKFMTRGNGYNGLTIELDTPAMAKKAIYKLERELNLSQKPANVASVAVFITKYSNGKYDIEMNVYYEDGDVDEVFEMEDNLSIHQAMAWIENWLKSYPKSKVYYYSENGTSFFGHKHKPCKKQPKYAYLENSVKKMF